MFANKATSLAVDRTSDDATAASSAAGVSLFPQRHAWLWAALPASASSVCVVDDPSLAEAVGMAGFELGDRGSADVSILAAGSDSGSGEDAGAILGAGDDEAVVVVIDRALERRSRAGAVRRAAARVMSALVALPTLRERRRIERLLARPGVRVDSLAMSDRARSTYQLGGPLWRRGVVPVGAIVWSLPDRDRTFVEAAVGEASAAIGHRLTTREMSIVESGKILVQLQDDSGEGWFLRLAGGPSAEYIADSLHALGVVADAGAPAAVRERTIKPLADGRIGPARYSIERRVEGAHPSRLTADLWDDCLEFLIRLRRLAPDSDRADSRWVARRLRPDLDLLAGVLGGAEDPAFEALEGRLAGRLGALSLGWEHGDFWAHNLITADGRLRAVLDWDTASADSLPLLDLYDLLSLPAGRRRHPQIGARLEGVLLPIAREGGDERVRAYCEATGTPLDPDLLEAVAAVYWVSRAARSVREYPLRARRESWVSENIRRPLNLLGGL